MGQNFRCLSAAFGAIYGKSRVCHVADPQILDKIFVYYSDSVLLGAADGGVDSLRLWLGVGGRGGHPRGGTARRGQGPGGGEGGGRWELAAGWEGVYAAVFMCRHANTVSVQATAA